MNDGEVSHHLSVRTVCPFLVSHLVFHIDITDIGFRVGELCILKARAFDISIEQVATIKGNL